MSGKSTYEQLVLDLFADEPWGGQSPRSLTRGYKPLFLRSEPHRHEVMDERDPNQYDLWGRMVHTERKLPRRSGGGASSLLPLPPLKRRT